MEESRNALKLVFISREVIKPSSSPTPNHQTTFKLSLLDQFSVQMYIPILLFYKGGGTGGGQAAKETSQRLKSSLSQTLTHFYPFAGRLGDHLSFSCNNEGAEYSEAQVLNCSLFSVLQKPNQKHLCLFLPEESSSTARPSLLIQVSFFGCGGMVLGMKFCHKIADAATCASFITCWANSAIGNTNSVTPDFRASSLFPPKDPSLTLQPPPPPPQDFPCATRTSRFVFGPAQLAALQAKAASANIPLPAHFQALSAFLWKTVSLVKKESTLGHCPKPSALMWAVNLRSRPQPPSSLEHCFGNYTAVPVAHDHGDLNLPILAGQLKRGTIDICNQYVKALKGGDGGHLGILELQMNTREVLDKAMAGTVECYIVSSWCKLAFYEADFGWGKPVWATPADPLEIPNMAVLMDTRDGLGIEAWVCLMEDDMDVLESNKELQEYASFNPSAFH